MEEAPEVPEGMEVEEHDPGVEQRNITEMRRKMESIDNMILHVTDIEPGATINMGECNNRILLLTSVSMERWEELKAEAGGSTKH